MTWPIDVYVCYARPVAAAGAFDLTAWSAKLVATLEECTNPRSFGDVPKVGFCPESLAADPAGVPADAVEQSALLLVLLSPELLADPARLAEIARFRAQAALDGRKPDQTVVITVATTPYEAGRSPELDWLLAGGTRAPGSQEFTASDGTPIEADRAGPGQEFEALIKPIQQVVGEIRRKLEALRGAPRAAPPTQPPPRPGRKPLVYLEAASSEQSWTQTRDALDGMANVNPAQWMAPTSDLRVRIQRKEDRRAFLLECKGQVLIRAAAADKFDLQVTEAQSARNELIDAGADAPPWVLVDWVPDAGPALQGWAELPRITTAEADWPARVREKLGL